MQNIKNTTLNLNDKIRIISNAGIYSTGRPICGSLAIIKSMTARFIMVETVNENIKLQLLPNEVLDMDSTWWGTNTNPKEFVRDYINTEIQLSGVSKWKVGNDGWATLEY